MLEIEDSTIESSQIQLKYHSKYEVSNGYNFYKFIESISKLIDELKVIVHKDKIELTFMDQSRIFLCSIIIEDNWSNTLKIDKTGEYGLNINDLAKLLKVIKSDKKSFILKFNTERLRIVKKKSNGFKATKELEFLDLELEDIPIKNLLEIPYPSKVKVQKQYIEDIFRELGDFSDVIGITLNEDELSFQESNSIGNGKLRIKYEDLYELETSTEESMSVSLDYFSLVKYLLPIMEKDQLIELKVRTDTPLAVTIEFDELGITFNSWIAPRVEEEDYDEDEEDFDEF